MENRNKGIFWLIILIIILCGYIIYDTFFNKSNDINYISSTTSTTTTKKIEKNNIIQTLNTNIGKFILSTNGYVYYVEPENNIFSTSITDYTNLGEKGIFTIDNYIFTLDDHNNEINTFEGYKLDIENITSLYEVYFGNGGINNNIIMLNNEGKISILTFILSDTNNLDIIFEKNIDEYKNIVSVLINQSFDGNSAILVDKDGKKYNLKFKKE